MGDIGWMKEHAPAFLLGVLIAGGGVGLIAERGGAGQVKALSETLAEVRVELRHMRGVVDEMRVEQRADQWSATAQREWTRDELWPRLNDLDHRLRAIEVNR